VEAWWKQQGENCCAIPTIPANTAARLVLRNCLKSRNLSQFSAIVHGSFATTHNLKVTGSNPVPATKSNNDIKRLETYLNSRALACPKHVNATLTFDESPCNPRGFLRSGVAKIACQQRAMIEFRTLPDDNPDLAHSPRFDRHHRML